MNRLERWREIWERKGIKAYGFDLHELIVANGYDMGQSSMSVETYLNYARVARNELDIQDGDTLLDIGCGSGAMLLLLSAQEIQIVGIDYSEAQIKTARRVVPGIVARVSGANHIPFQEGMFSKVLSCSVFQYFPNLKYATEVLLEIKRVLSSDGKALIMDIPDLLKKNMKDHLYYSQSFFEDFAKSQNMNITVSNQDVPGYAASLLRFNVVLWRQV